MASNPSGGAMWGSCTQYAFVFMCFPSLLSALLSDSRIELSCLVPAALSPHLERGVSWFHLL